MQTQLDKLEAATRSLVEAVTALRKERSMIENSTRTEERHELSKIVVTEELTQSEKLYPATIIAKIQTELELKDLYANLKVVQRTGLSQSYCITSGCCRSNSESVTAAIDACLMECNVPGDIFYRDAEEVIGSRVTVARAYKEESERAGTVYTTVYNLAAGKTIVVVLGNNYLLPASVEAVQGADMYLYMFGSAVREVINKIENEHN